jgi:hypothetical protein
LRPFQQQPKRIAKINMKIPKALILSIALAIMSFTGLAEDTKPVHWYTVTFHYGSAIMKFCGTSSLDEAALAK